MNLVDIKNCFMSFLSKTIGMFKPEIQREILTKMKDEWIPEFFDNFSKNYAECEHCKAFNLKSNYIREKITEIRKDVFLEYPLDPNDFDEIWGDAKFEVIYEVCPVCGHKKEISKKRLKVLNFYYV